MCQLNGGDWHRQRTKTKVGSLRIEIGKGYFEKNLNNFQPILSEKIGSCLIGFGIFNVIRLGNQRTSYLPALLFLSIYRKHGDASQCCLLMQLKSIFHELKK